MSRRGRRPELTIGGGARENYVALLLFLVGALLGMFAVYMQLNHAPYLVPLVAALLCALAAILLVAAKKDQPR